MNPKEAQAWPRLCLDIQAERDEAIAQRDELVAALKAALADLDRLAAVGRCSGKMQGAVAARATLAKVKS